MYNYNFMLFFFFNAPATTEIYTLSLHDALPISTCPDSTKNWVSLGECTALRYSSRIFMSTGRGVAAGAKMPCHDASYTMPRSEEHTSELQSQSNLVCRLLLEKKKKKKKHNSTTN